MTDLIDTSAIALAKAIRTKKVSSVEVVELHLQRIETVNSKLNAIVQLSQTAWAEARAADEALARGEANGALHGVPFTVKDWIETKGLICAAGVEERREHVPKHDATVVARLLGNAIDIERLKQEPDAWEFNIRGCRYADFFRQLGEPELGAVLLCDVDVDIEAVGSPEVEMTRTQTIMKGAEYCDFRFRMKPSDKAKQ